MRFFLNIFLFISGFLLIGCGGGSGDSESSIGGFPAQYTMQNVDITDKQQMVIDKNNAKELLEISNAFSIAGNVGRYEIEEFISQRINNTQPCPGGGTMSVKTSTNQARLLYNECNLEVDFKVDGEVLYTLDKRINGVKADFVQANNLKMLLDGESVLLNYTIRRSEEAGDVVILDYYLDMINFDRNESAKMDLTIYQEGESAHFSGVYLLDDKEYFTLSSNGYSNDGVEWWFGPYETYLYDFSFNSSEATLNLAGSESNLIYTNTPYGNLFILEDNNGFRYALDKRVLSWSENLSDVVPNEMAPVLFVRLGSEQIFDNQKVLVYDQNQTLVISSDDFDAETGKYELSVELQSKPVESNLTLDIHEISYHDFSNLQYALNLDTSGRYTFKVNLKDGDYRNAKTFSIDFYQTGLSENQHSVEGNILDTLLIPSSGSIVFLSGNPDNRLTIIDPETNTQLSSIGLPNTPAKMTLNEEESQIIVSSDAKVFVIDATDTTEPTLEKTFAIPDKLGDIETYNGYAYVLAKNYSGTIYSINLLTGVYDTIEAFYGGQKLILNRELEALYMLKHSGSPQKITRVDISNGNAENLSDSRYHGDFNYCSNMWIIAPNNLLTACGVQLLMSNTHSEDILYNGTLESPNFIQSQSGILENIIYAVDMDEVTNMLAIIIGEMSSHYDTYGTPSSPNILEIRDQDTLRIQSSAILKKYWEEGGILYQLFVESVKILSDKEVLIVYRGVENNQYTYDGSKDKFLYEIKKI